MASEDVLPATKIPARNTKLFSAAGDLAGRERVNQQYALIQEAFGRRAVPFPEQELRNCLTFYSHWFSLWLEQPRPSEATVSPSGDSVRMDHCASPDREKEVNSWTSNMTAFAKPLFAFSQVPTWLCGDEMEQADFRIHFIFLDFLCVIFF